MIAVLRRAAPRSSATLSRAWVAWSGVRFASILKRTSQGPEEEDDQSTLDAASALRVSEPKGATGPAAGVPGLTREEKSVAQRLAELKGCRLPDQILHSTTACRNFIAGCQEAAHEASVGSQWGKKVPSANDPAPTEKQMMFAKTIEGRAGVEIPNGAKVSRVAMSNYISQHAPCMSNIEGKGRGGSPHDTQNPSANAAQTGEEKNEDAVQGVNLTSNSDPAPSKLTAKEKTSRSTKKQQATKELSPSEQETTEDLPSSGTKKKAKMELSHESLEQSDPRSPSGDTPSLPTIEASTAPRPRRISQMLFGEIESLLDKASEGKKSIRASSLRKKESAEVQTSDNMQSPTAVPRKAAKKQSRAAELQPSHKAESPTAVSLEVAKKQARGESGHSRTGAVSQGEQDKHMSRASAKQASNAALRLPKAVFAAEGIDAVTKKIQKQQKSATPRNQLLAERMLKRLATGIQSLL